MIDEVPQSPESPRSPERGTRMLPPPFASPTRSNSFRSPKPAIRPSLEARAHSFSARGRRLFDVDGDPLPHWDKSNFEPSRDETCRVVYKPKQGTDFFEKNLQKADFEVLRRVTIEQPFYSKYNRYYPTSGHFCCKACGNAIYSHQTKLRKFDGWPSFGACVDGAVAMTPPEVRKAQKEKEAQSATRIQAFMRGCLSRSQTSQQLGMLIDQMMVLQQDVEEELKEEPLEDEPFDMKRPNRDLLFTNLSLHSLNDFDLFDESFSSAESFMGDEPSISNEDLSLRSEEDEQDDEEITKPLVTCPLDDEFVEIHCHRCKSHLGNILEEDSRGRDGDTAYHERHRVNGRALKYVEDDLPKRTLTSASLLFANQSQKRLMGWRAAAKQQESQKLALLYSKPRSGPFVSPRAKKKSVGQQSGGWKSPVPKPRPGVGIRGVAFQIPMKSPTKSKGRSKKNKLEDFFLSRSVH